MIQKTLKLTYLRKYVGCLILMGLLINLFGCAEESSKSVVSFKQKPGKLFIFIDDDPFATYVYEDSAITRPYFAHVKTPCGIQATRNHPPKPDDPQDHQTFHPGIWMSFGDISGNDYWRLKQKVEHEMFVEQPEGGVNRGTFTVRNYYMDNDDKTRLLAELVEYTILVRPSGYLLLWESTFTSDEADFTFGDQEEMGLGIRVNTKISVQYGQGHITNAEGMKDEKGTWGKSSNWIDYSGRINDEYIGVVIMPDPENFRPSWFHSRDYGYIAANPFGREAMKQGEKSAVTVKKGEKFHLGYGVLVYCNTGGTKINIDNAYRDYLDVIKTNEQSQ